MSPPVSQERYKRQMFIENRIEERNEQIVVLERSDEKIRRSFRKWEHTTRSLSDAKALGGGKQCRKMKFRKKRSFQHNPKQTIICEAQARSELEEF